MDTSGMDTMIVKGWVVAPDRRILTADEMAVMEGARGFGDQVREVVDGLH